MDAVVHFTEVLNKTSLASARVARFIATELGLEIIDNANKADKYETLIVVNSPFAFCTWRETAKELIEKADRYIWVQNDYAIDNPLKRKPDEIWSIIVKEGTKYINWNSLMFKPNPKPLKKKYVDGLLYYGAYRKGRIKYFEKYLKDKPYNVYILSSKNGARQFFKLLRNKAKYFPPISDPTLLEIFAATIYLEDEISHTMNMSPANRFYECLSSGIAMGIDPAAAHTLTKEGVKNVDKYLINDEKDVLNLIENYKNIAAEQYKLWAKDYRAELKQRLHELWQEHKGKD